MGSGQIAAFTSCRGQQCNLSSSPVMIKLRCVNTLIGAICKKPKDIVAINQAVLKQSLHSMLLQANIQASSSTLGQVPQTRGEEPQMPEQISGGYSHGTEVIDMMPHLGEAPDSGQQPIESRLAGLNC